jgi:hypothetical protein
MLVVQIEVDYWIIRGNRLFEVGQIGVGQQPKPDVPLVSTTHAPVSFDRFLGPPLRPNPHPASVVFAEASMLLWVTY